jgi:exopolysaccharide biosynthesis polyprenyl glycosylphosphotransferase
MSTTVDGIATPTTAEVASLEDAGTGHSTRMRVRHKRGWVIRRLLLAADLSALVGAFGLSELIFWSHYQPVVGSLGRLGEFLVFLASLPLWVVGIKLFGLYERDEQRADHSTSDEVASVFHLLTGAVWVFFAASWLLGLRMPDAEKLVVFWLLAIALVSGNRVVVRTLARRRHWYAQNAIVLGAGEVGQLIGRKLLHHREYGLHLVGFVDAAPRERRADLDDLTLIGPPEDLLGIIERHDIERVIVAFSNESHEDILDLLRSLKDLDIQVDIVPRLFEIIGPAMQIHSIEGVPIVSLPPLRLSRSSRLLKRMVDLVFTTALIALLAPFMALIALLIKIDSRGPAFFRQIRVGSGSLRFEIFKFRTMYRDADERKADFSPLNKHAQNGDPRMFKIPNDPRITRVGRWLRRYSLDELPQLFNVLKGEMSLVGPRPLIVDEDDCVGDWARRRLDLKPGMTGLWQVTGRSEMLFDEMVKLDYVYVTGWSLGGDLKLMARTLPSIWRVRDVY